MHRICYILYLCITLHTYKTRSSLQSRKFGISVKELDFMSLKIKKAICRTHIGTYIELEAVIVKKRDNK